MCFSRARNSQTWLSLFTTTAATNSVGNVRVVFEVSLKFNPAITDFFWPFGGGGNKLRTRQWRRCVSKRSLRHTCYGGTLGFIWSRVSSRLANVKSDICSLLVPVLVSTISWCAAGILQLLFLWNQPTTAAKYDDAMRAMRVIVGQVNKDLKLCLKQLYWIIKINHCSFIIVPVCAFHIFRIKIH